MKSIVLVTHVCRNPYTYLTALLLCVSTYLCLVNLNYARLWVDESNTALVGSNLLQTGTLTGWDGRNLVSYEDGKNLNSELKEVLPPLQYLFTAVGISLFGFNEIGIRSIHAFIGVLALIMFLLLLRQQLPNNQRLVFFIMLFVCLSPQLLLYFRSARYFSFAVFSFAACLYFYEQYWRSGRLISLIALTTLGILSFLNHYTMGIAGMLAIAIFHILFRAKTTDRKRWLMFALACLTVSVACSLYLYAAGIISSDHGMIAFYNEGHSHISSPAKKIWMKVSYTLLKMIASDWFSWSLCLCFLVQWALLKKVTCQAKVAAFQKSSRLVFVGLLSLLLGILITPHKSVDLRLLAAFLPLALVMKGVVINWLADRYKLISSLVLVILLFTSMGAFPVSFANIYTKQFIHGAWLWSFLKEIHHPYLPDPTDEVAKYLQRHADKDDLVYVPNASFRENLIFYAGDNLLMCCQIEPDNERLRDKVDVMRSSLIKRPDIIPDWIIIVKPDEDSFWNFVGSVHHHNWDFTNIPLSASATNSPELDRHTFAPFTKPLYGGIHILRRKEKPATDTWF